MKNKSPLGDLSNAELVTMLTQTNSSEALDTLMKRHKEDLERIGNRFLQRAVLKEDLLQDVWLEVLESIHAGRYFENAHFAEWLHTVTFRIARRIARKERYLSYNEDDYTYAEEFIAAPEPPDNREEEINEKLKVLTPGERRVMRKRLIEEKSIKETAEELKITESAVRAICSNALKKINKAASEKAASTKAPTARKKYFQKHKRNGWLVT